MAGIPQLDDFAREAAAFCAWAEAPPGPLDEEVDTALRLVSQLYRLALDLPDLFDEECAADIPHEHWAAIHQRFGMLPLDYYGVCLDPADLTDLTLGLGDVADDLADIWRDMKGGLALYRKGNRAAAAWEWRNAFRTHWGQHATSVLHALHCSRS